MMGGAIILGLQARLGRWHPSNHPLVVYNSTLVHPYTRTTVQWYNGTSVLDLPCLAIHGGSLHACSCCPRPRAYSCIFRVKQWLLAHASVTRLLMTTSGAEAPQGHCVLRTPSAMQLRPSFTTAQAVRGCHHHCTGCARLPSPLHRLGTAQRLGVAGSQQQAPSAPGLAWQLARHLPTYLPTHPPTH